MKPFGVNLAVIVTIFLYTINNVSGANIPDEDYEEEPASSRDARQRQQPVFPKLSMQYHNYTRYWTKMNRNFLQVIIMFFSAWQRFFATCPQYTPTWPLCTPSDSQCRAGRCGWWWCPPPPTSTWSASLTSSTWPTCTATRRWGVSWCCTWSSTSSRTTRQTTTWGGCLTTPGYTSCPVWTLMDLR